MPPPSLEERTIYRTLRAEMKRMGISAIVEYTVSTGRKPTRFRHVDLRFFLPDEQGEMWVEIDGPNHRGKRNIDRDRDLAALAIERRVTLLHWPLWKVLDSGMTPLLQAILRGEKHHGHVEPDIDRYRVWDSRYSQG